MTYLLTAIGTLIGVELLLVASAFVGNWVIGIYLSNNKCDPGRLLLGLGVGLSFLSFLVFSVFILQVFTTMVLTGVAIFWVLLGSYLGWKQWTDIRQTLDGLSPLSKGTVIVFGIFLIISLFNLLPALMPSTDWDGLAYHLALPKIYLEHGGFLFRPDIFHNLFPQFTEMLYAFGLLTPHGSGAKVIHFEFGVLSALAVFVLGRQFKLNHFWSAFAMLVFYSQYIVHMESGTTFIELSYTFYASIGIIALVKGLTAEQSFKWHLLAMLFLGVTAAIKWHGLIILVLGFGAVLSSRYLVLKEKLGSHFWKNGFYFGVISLIPLAPYAIRNIFVTGNPIWPLGFHWFGAPYWDAGFALRIKDIMKNFAGSGTTLVDFIRLPYDFIVNGSLFSVGGHEFRWPLAATIIVIIFYSVYFVMLLFKKKLELSRLNFWKSICVFFVLSYVFVWFKSSPQFRFLLPLLPLWALFMTRLLNNWWFNEKRELKIAAVGMAIMLFAFHPPVHKNTPEQINVLLGLQTPEHYCSKQLKHFKAIQHLNRFVGPQEKVLLFGENRGFYLDVQYLWGDPMLQKVVDYRSMTSPGELANRLQDLGVSWILYRTDLYDTEYLDSHTNSLIHGVLEQFGDPVFVNDPVKVFKLNFVNYAKIRIRDYSELE